MTACAGRRSLQVTGAVQTEGGSYKLNGWGDEAMEVWSRSALSKKICSTSISEADSWFNHITSSRNSRWERFLSTLIIFRIINRIHMFCKSDTKVVLLNPSAGNLKTDSYKILDHGSINNLFPPGSDLFFFFFFFRPRLFSHHQQDKSLPVLSLHPAVLQLQMFLNFKLKTICWLAMDLINSFRLPLGTGW